MVPWEEKDGIAPQSWTIDYTLPIRIGLLAVASYLPISRHPISMFTNVTLSVVAFHYHYYFLTGRKVALFSDINTSHVVLIRLLHCRFEISLVQRHYLPMQVSLYIIDSLNRPSSYPDSRHLARNTCCFIILVPQFLIRIFIVITIRH